MSRSPSYESRHEHLAPDLSSFTSDDEPETESYEQTTSIDEEWTDEFIDELHPTDSVSLSPAEAVHQRSAQRQRQHTLHPHRPPSPSPGYSYVVRPGPNQPANLDLDDNYHPRGYYQSPAGGAPYYGRGGQQAPPYPAPHAGAAPGYYPAQQVVPYGPNSFPGPFAAAQPGNYFQADHRLGGWGSSPPGEAMMPYNQAAFWPPPGAYPQLPAVMPYQHWGSPPPPPPTEAPAPPKSAPPPEPPKPDPEKEAMSKELEQFKTEQAKKERAAEQAAIEAKIRKEAEETFIRKMEQMKMEEKVRAEERAAAEERAKKELEQARKEAERAAREAVEAERKAEADRKKAEAEVLARAEREARDKLDAERKAEEARKKKEAEAAAAAEVAAKARLDAALLAREQATAAAKKAAEEEAARLKTIEETAKLVAEKEARAKIEAEAKAAEAAKAAEDAKKKEQDAFKKKALEEAKNAAEEAHKKSLGKDKAPIHLKDAIGRKYDIPFQNCQTWQAMEDMIKQAFHHIPEVGPAVNAGHYDLLNPKGDIILKSVWNKVIEPDWTIEMRMWPQPAPPQFRQAHTMGGSPPRAHARPHMPGFVGMRPMQPAGMGPGGAIGMHPINGMPMNAGRQPMGGPPPVPQPIPVPGRGGAMPPRIIDVGPKPHGHKKKSSKQPSPLTTWWLGGAKKPK